MKTDIANDNFNRARWHETIQRIRNILNPDDNDLLSLHDVRKVLRPEGEQYQGYAVVPIDKIIGSEGRYRDFSRTYLPKYEHSRKRWTSIDVAHQDEIELPAVNLYEIAGYYFVRDGNHRVSVARTMGMTHIDAIVVKLDTRIDLENAVTKTALKERVLAYERNEFYADPVHREQLHDTPIRFSETGRFDELVKHFVSHQHYLESQHQAGRQAQLPPTQQRQVPTASDNNAHTNLVQIPRAVAIQSWKNNIYLPIVEVIKKQKILQRFPNRTESDLYVWIVRHENRLEHEPVQNHSQLTSSVERFSKKYGKNRWQRFVRIVKHLTKIMRSR